MKSNRFVYSLALSLFIASSLSLFFLSGMFGTWDTKLTDRLFVRQPATNDILIVAIDDKSLQSIGRWPWNRSVYSEYLPVLSKADVVGIDIAFFEKSGNDTPLIDVTRQLGNIVYPVEYTLFSSSEEMVGVNLLKPLPEIQEYAYGLGHINLFTDQDGLVRSVAVTMNGTEPFDSFSKVVAEKFIGMPIGTPSQRILINFIGPPKSFNTISFSDLKNHSPADFEGKIVLIGATSPDLHDDELVPTSEGKLMPGVEIHANIVQQMLTGRYLIPESSTLVIITIFIISLAMGLAFYKIPVALNAILAVAILIAYALISINQFDNGMVLNMFYPLSAAVLSFFGLTGLYYAIETREKGRIKDAFGKYVSPLVVNELLEHSEKLKLGGENRHIVIMFSDIRNFTTISEALGPERLVAFLNEYLTAMTSIVLARKGLLDKYIGDAIMAFWGAPLDQDGKEETACNVALEMMEKLKELRKGWTRLPPVDIGIGLSEGKCVVGNIGSHERFDYTAIGDRVNLASRLEGLNKQYGTNIIVSEGVYEKVKGSFVFRKLDFVRVKGKKNPERIFELVGKTADKRKRAEIEIYERGLEKYLDGDFNGAIKEFSHIDDKASHVLSERCRALKKNPPKGWDGVFEFSTK